jgi:hypothetical protein
MTDQMYRRLKLPLVLLLFVVAGTPLRASSHPLKASASLIEYDSVNKTIRMECKVFIDDFQRSLLNSVAKGIDPSTVKRKDRHRLIEAYFELFYAIEHNGKRVPLKLKALTPLSRQNVLVIQFAKVPLKIQVGDKLRIENTMFFRDFGAAQTNRIAVRIPPFNIRDGHVATIRNHIFSYTFGASKK